MERKTTINDWVISAREQEEDRATEEYYAMLRRLELARQAAQVLNTPPVQETNKEK